MTISKILSHCYRVGSSIQTIDSDRHVGAMGHGCYRAELGHLGFRVLGFGEYSYSGSKYYV